MSEISDARSRLHAQLQLYLDPVLGPERVHEFIPSIVASPTVWIGPPGTSTVTSGSPGARVKRVSFVVSIIPDGDTEQAQRWLDEMTGRVADALYDLPQCDDDGSRAVAIDIGGSSTRAIVFTATMAVFAHSFCDRPVAPKPFAAVSA